MWKEAYRNYNLSLYNISIVQYEKAHPCFKYEGDFLMNYGKALSMASYHADAISILNRTRDYLDNSMIQIALGNSFNSMNNIDQAEAAYLMSNYMIPHLLYPKYLLVKLYKESGNNIKAIKVGNHLLSMDVKINSTFVDKIKDEVRELVEITN